MMAPNYRNGDIRMSHNFDVFVHFLKGFGRTFRVIVHEHSRLHEQNNENLDSSLGCLAQHPIQTVFYVLIFDCAWPPHQKMRSQHPIRNTYLIFGMHHACIHILEVTTPIIVKLNWTFCSQRCKARKSMILGVLFLLLYIVLSHITFLSCDLLIRCLIIGIYSGSSQATCEVDSLDVIIMEVDLPWLCPSGKYFIYYVISVSFLFNFH